MSLWSSWLFRNLRNARAALLRIQSHLLACWRRHPWHNFESFSSLNRLKEKTFASKRIIGRNFFKKQEGLREEKEGACCLLPLQSVRPLCHPPEKQNSSVSAWKCHSGVQFCSLPGFRSWPCKEQLSAGWSSEIICVTLRMAFGISGNMYVIAQSPDRLGLWRWFQPDFVSCIWATVRVTLASLWNEN